MQVTFMIGNGFDLGMGLQTRYTDFLPVYCAAASSPTISPANLNVLNKFKLLLANEKAEWGHTWADFERELGRRTTEPPLSNEETLRFCLRNFKEHFRSYLEEQQRRVNYENSPDLGKKFLNAVERVQQLLPRGRWDKAAGPVFSGPMYNFICFNYTDVLDRCIGVARAANKNRHFPLQLASLCHVHGTLENGLILGVNDVSQIAHPKLSAAAKAGRLGASLVKPRINEALGYDQDAISRELIQESDLICIYGMSLGETDCCWWETVGGWLQADANHQLMIFARKRDLNAWDTDSIIDAKEAVLSRFITLSESWASENIRNQTTIVLNNELFALEEAISLRPAPKAVAASKSTLPIAT